MAVKTAPLYDNIEEEIFMECPQGMVVSLDDDILALNKYILSCTRTEIEKMSTLVCCGNSMKWELSL